MENFVNIWSYHFWQAQIISIILHAKQGFIHPLLISEKHHRSVLIGIQTNLGVPSLNFNYEISMGFSKKALVVNIHHGQKMEF